MASYRSIFISDVHLGTRGCSAQHLTDFLKNNHCDHLYLIGDIVDGWRLHSKWYWPQSHSDVVRKILTKAKRGTQVIYVTGNHDEFLRNFTSFALSFGNIEVVDEAEHTAPNGDKFWIIHGDDYDGITRYHKWVALLGDIGYNALILLNRWYNFLRRKFGFGYWSLSRFIKYKVKTAVNFISEFETTIARDAASKGYKGVFCGHIHHPEMRDINGVLYCNTGDWVETCSAIVEHWDGRLEIIHWQK
jgi:UDP-2,3-diacylglucosamine pyrophosphatase LpxH